MTHPPTPEQISRRRNMPRTWRALERLEIRLANLENLDLQTEEGEIRSLFVAEATDIMTGHAWLHRIEYTGRSDLTFIRAWFAGATLWDFWNNRSLVPEEEKPPAETGG